jgi:hypothetical protein
MSDASISALNPADLPLSDEQIPCVQAGINKRAPAAAFGVPVVGLSTPALAQYQTWIDTSTTPPALRMYIGSDWVALYTIAGDGSLALARPLALPGDPASDLDAATKSYVDNNPAAPGALMFVAPIDCSTNPNYPAANQGAVYIVSVAGKIGGASGINVQIGDMLLCLVNGSISDTQAGVGANWTIARGIGGAVIGPSSAVSGNFALFGDATGKAIIDGSISLDTDATFAANSDTRVPSQKAVKSAIGGKLLSTDTLTQGQSWIWDGVTSTFRARDCEGKNFLGNPAFDIWQENTAYTIFGGTPRTHTADFWKAGTKDTSGAAKTVTRVAGLSGAQYAMKCQRTAGDSVCLGKFRIAQQFGQAESMFLAGKNLVVSFDFVVGANYSATVGDLMLNFACGNGVDEALDLHLGTPQFATNPVLVGSAALTGQVAAAGTVARINSGPIAIPAGITELAMFIRTGDYTGTAGADDSFTIGNVKLEISNLATPFRKPDTGDEFRRCQRRYWKSFLKATVPVNAAGAGTGEHRAAATKAGAAQQTLGTVRYPAMRAVPAMTLFNPATGASGQARDLTAAADCTSTAAQNISDGGCEIVATGASSTALGNTLGVHVVADARL